MTCKGLSVRVYMPGRCLTGSRPLSTRIELSEYSLLEETGEGLAAMGADCSVLPRKQLGKYTGTSVVVDEGGRCTGRRCIGEI